MNKLLCKQDCAWKRSDDKCQSAEMRAQCRITDREITAQKIIDTSGNRLLSPHEISNIAAAFNKVHKDNNKAEFAQIVAWAKQTQANYLLLGMVTKDNGFGTVDIIEGEITVKDVLK